MYEQMQYGVHNEDGIGLAYSSVLAHDHVSEEPPQEVRDYFNVRIDNYVALAQGAINFVYDESAGRSGDARSNNPSPTRYHHSYEDHPLRQSMNLSVLTAL